MSVPQMGGCCMCAREPADIALVREMAFETHIGDGVAWIRRVVPVFDSFLSFKEAPPFQSGSAWVMQGLRYVMRLPYLNANDNDWTTDPIPYPYLYTKITTPGRLALTRFIHRDSHASPIQLSRVEFTPAQSAPGEWKYELYDWYRQRNSSISLNQFNFGGTYGPPNRDDLDKWAITHYRITLKRRQDDGSFLPEESTGVRSCYIPHRNSPDSSAGRWPFGSAPYFKPDNPIVHTFDSPITMNSDDEILVDYWYTQKLMYPWSHPPLSGPPFVQQAQYESPVTPGVIFPMWGLLSRGTPWFPTASVRIEAADANYRVPRVMKYRLRFPENHPWRPGNAEFVDLAKSGVQRAIIARLRPTPAAPFASVWAVPSAANIDDPITDVDDGDGIACEQHGTTQQTQKWRFTPKTESGPINKVTVHALMKCGPAADACPVPTCRVQLSFNPSYPSSGPLQFSVPLIGSISLTTVYQWFTYELAVPGIGFGESDSSAAVSLTSQGNASDSVLYLDALYLDAGYDTRWWRTSGPAVLNMRYSGEMHEINFDWGTEYPAFVLKRGTSVAMYRVANPLGYDESYLDSSGTSNIRVLDPGQWNTRGTSVWQLDRPTAPKLAVWPNQFELERYQ